MRLNPDPYRLERVAITGTLVAQNRVAGSIAASGRILGTIFGVITPPDLEEPEPEIDEDDMPFEFANPNLLTAGDIGKLLRWADIGNGFGPALYEQAVGDISAKFRIKVINAGATDYNFRADSSAQAFLKLVFSGNPTDGEDLNFNWKVQGGFPAGFTSYQFDFESVLGAPAPGEIQVKIGATFDDTALNFIAAAEKNLPEGLLVFSYDYTSTVLVTAGPKYPGTRAHESLGFESFTGSITVTDADGSGYMNNAEGFVGVPGLRLLPPVSEAAAIPELVGGAAQDFLVDTVMSTLRDNLKTAVEDNWVTTFSVTDDPDDALAFFIERIPGPFDQDSEEFRNMEPLTTNYPQLLQIEKVRPGSQGVPVSLDKYLGKMTAYDAETDMVTVNRGHAQQYIAETPIPIGVKVCGGAGGQIQIAKPGIDEILGTSRTLALAQGDLVLVEHPEENE